MEFHFRLKGGEYCAGGEVGKDLCNAVEGGSPLVCQSNVGNWHVVGLLSFGLDCSKDDIPRIFTNLYHYEDFIDSKSHRRD